MSFLMNVNGCSLEIPGLYSSLTFSTQSNALFASLFTKHANLPLKLFDDLLELFRHPDFRTEEVTLFQNPEDIMIIDHFSQQRRTIASLRSEKSQTATFSNPIPQIIVEHVAEHLDAQRTPFHRVYQKTYPKCDADRSLRAMTLVHPSWTEPAQRCLRRRVFIKSLSGLHKMCKGRQLGPWVRELCFRRSTRSPTCSVVCAVDASRLLCVVLKNCPNVRQLSLTDILPVHPYDHCDIHGTVSSGINIHRDVLHQLAQCQYLEDLWLIQESDPSEKGLAELCTLLPRLTVLKSLHLQGLQASEQRNVIRPTHAGWPSPSLKTLSLRHIASSPLFAFLRKKYDGYHPTTLEISMEDVRESEEYFHTFLAGSNPLPLLQPILSSITKLCICDCAGDHDVSTVARQFPSLETLSLQGPGSSGLSLIPLNLPLSTQKLHIHFVDIPLRGDQDTLALASLTACPQIKVFTITYPARFGGPEGEDIERATFSTTSEYCSHNNVDFEVTGIDYLPSALDL